MNDASRFFARLRAVTPRETALLGAHSRLTYAALLDAVDGLAETLLRRRVQVLASVLPNGPAWAIVDLAALRAGIVHVPLPQFFTAAQQTYACAAAGVDALLETPPGPGDGAPPIAVAGEQLLLRRRPAEPVAMPPAACKVTFTSGSTGEPKGVCLGADAMLAVADGLAQALAPVGLRRHLCALPLPVLLENIAGLYAPLLAGGAVLLPDGDEAGLTGSSSFDPAQLNAAVQRHRADSLIVLPQMLRAWSAWREAVRALPLATLKFVAVGGARVGHAALAQARRAGLPAYEGYGLSEAASVQTLNLPYADRPGSAGRPLPHAQVRVGTDGEVLVAGSLMLGYLGAASQAAPSWWATGDLGRLDGDGFLHLEGRRRNVLITSFGRNVSPEWVEAELQAQPAIGQAAVFGDGQPQLSAVLWPARADATDDLLAAAVAQTNARLPDYARVARWLRARRPFSVAAGMATANGRPRREAIAQAHQEVLDAAAGAANDLSSLDR